MRFTAIILIRLYPYMVRPDKTLLINFSILYQILQMKSKCFYVEVNARWLCHLSPTVGWLHSPSSLRCRIFRQITLRVLWENPHENLSIPYFIMNTEKEGHFWPSFRVHGGDDGNRTHVRKHFQRNFSERSFCFKVSHHRPPKSRLPSQLSR